MKKIVFLPLIALCLPLALLAQSVDDDLYYVPTKKEKKTVVEERNTTPAAETVVVKTNAPTTVYSSTGNTTVVVKDRKGNVRDVDEYNRRGIWANDAAEDSLAGGDSTEVAARGALDSGDDYECSKFCRWQHDDRR